MSRLRQTTGPMVLNLIVRANMVLRLGIRIFITCIMFNMEINVLRIIICLRKSEVSVERISVYNAIEKLLEHIIHCLPCSYTNDVIILLATMTSY